MYLFVPFSPTQFHDSTPGTASDKEGSSAEAPLPPLPRLPTVAPAAANAPGRAMTRARRRREQRQRRRRAVDRIHVVILPFILSF